MSSDSQIPTVTAKPEKALRGYRTVKLGFAEDVREGDDRLCKLEQHDQCAFPPPTDGRSTA